MSTPDPLGRQVAGTHYQVHAIQPIEISMGNRLSAAAAFALKHMARPGKRQLPEDIEKCLHYLEFMGRKWPAVSAHDYIIGLAPDVPEWMRQVSWHIAMTANPLANFDEHRRDAMRILQEQGARLRAGQS